MNYENELRTIFSSANISFTERMKIVEAHFEISGKQLPPLDDIATFLSVLPMRDEGKISLKDECDRVIQITKQTDPIDLKYENLCNEIKEDIIEVDVEITKSIFDGRFSVYNYDSFIKDIEELSLQNVMTAFSLLLSGQNQIWFEVFDKEDVFWATSTMVFSSEKTRVDREPIDRTLLLDNCRSVSFFYNTSDLQILPDDFHLEIKNSEEVLNDVFKCIETILALIYISSSSYIGEKRLKLQISGQRSLEFNYTLDNIGYNPEIFKIYHWIFTDGNVVDKAAIARNILCLHCKFSELREIDDKTFSSIQSNFNLYLKNNVNQYLELKNCVANYIAEVVTKTGEYTISLLGKLKTNLVTICGFLFTVILANIVSEQPLENIFTKDITVLCEIILLGSVVYMLISVFEIYYQRRKMKESYFYLKKNYEDIFSTEELNEIFGNDKMFNDAQNSVKKGIITFSIFWSVFIAVAFFIVEELSVAPVLLK